MKLTSTLPRSNTGTISGKMAMPDAVFLQSPDHSTQMCPKGPRFSIDGRCRMRLSDGLSPATPPITFREIPESAFNTRPPVWAESVRLCVAPAPGLYGHSFEKQSQACAAMSYKPSKNRRSNRLLNNFSTKATRTKQRSGERYWMTWIILKRKVMSELLIISQLHICDFIAVLASKCNCLNA